MPPQPGVGALIDDDYCSRAHRTGVLIALRRRQTPDTDPAREIPPPNPAIATAFDVDEPRRRIHPSLLRRVADDGTPLAPPPLVRRLLTIDEPQIDRARLYAARRRPVFEERPLDPPITPPPIKGNVVIEDGAHRIPLPVLLRRRANLDEPWLAMQIEASTCYASVDLVQSYDCTLDMAVSFISKITIAPGT